jgi:hypothetical protein
MSKSFLAVVGYSSVAELIDLVDSWALVAPKGRRARLLFGTEPFIATTKNFTSPRM